MQTWMWDSEWSVRRSQSRDKRGLMEPGEGALDDPTLADKLEALGIIAAADDLQMQLAKGTQPFDPSDQCTGIAAIRPDDLQPAEEKAEAREERDGPVAVLNGGGSHANSQKHAEGVHQDVSLAPAYPLAGIVANGIPTLLGTFDALAVEDSRAGSRLAAFGDAHLLPQPMVEFFPQAALAPGSKVIKHRGLGRKVLGRHAPLAAASIDIEDRVEDHSAAVLDGAPAALGLWNQRLDDVPFVVCEVTLIGLVCVHSKLDACS